MSSMRRRIEAFVTVAFVVLCTGVRSFAKTVASAANKKREVRTADSSKAPVGFAGGCWIQERG